MDAGEALPAAHEVDERLSASCRGGGVVRIVEECAGRAGEKDCIVLLEVRLVDVSRVVRDRRSPRAGLLSHLLDRPPGERNRRVHEAGGLAEDEHLAGLLRLGGRRGRQRGQHGRDVCRIRRLVLCRASTAAGRRCRRWQHGVQSSQELFLRQKAGLRGIPLSEPFLERRPHLVARHRAVLVGVDHGKDGWTGVPPPAAASLPLHPTHAARHQHDRAACHGEQIASASQTLDLMRPPRASPDRARRFHYDGSSSNDYTLANLLGIQAISGG